MTELARQQLTHEPPRRHPRNNSQQVAKRFSSGKRFQIQVDTTPQRVRFARPDSPIAVQSSEAARLSQWQRRTRRAQDFLRQFLIVDETGKNHRADHG
jgi:hypothetical protein